MIILLFLLVIVAVFVGMYNIYGRQKAQIKHLFQHIEPLLHRQIEWLQQQLSQQTPRDVDTEKRLNDLIWRLKSRNVRLNERVVLYNTIHTIAQKKDILLPNDAHNNSEGMQEDEITNINEQLHHAFQAYNMAVKEYNDMLSKFPTQIIAALFNHHKMKTFQ